MRRDVFQAISDPTRRQIIHILAHGPLNINAVAGNFMISRPAVSRHMKILVECGLIVIRKEGRERFCEANLRSLEEVAEWVETYRPFWTRKMDALEDFLNTTAAQVVTGKKLKQGRNRKT